MVRAAVVIGAGAAGLSAARELKRSGWAVVVLEREAAPGASWRGRYARLRLNTVRWMSGLPGGRLPRSLGRWVPRDAYAVHLERYASEAGLDVRTHTTARRVDREDGRWIVRTDEKAFRADLVVVAAGYDRIPREPTWPGKDGFTGELTHAGYYQDAAPYVGRDVLVAGAGSTGLEIATDLAEGGARRVRLAQRTPPNFVSREWLGLPLTPLAVIDRAAPARVVDAIGWLLQRLQHGDLTAFGMPPAEVGMGTRLREDGRGPVIVDGFAEALRSGRVEVVGAVERIENEQVVLAGGLRVTPDTIIAATGYERGLEELVGHLDVLDGQGRPRTVHGAVDRTHPGLFFLGYTVPLSGQLFEIARDARRITRAANRERPRVATEPTTGPAALAEVARAAFGTDAAADIVDHLEGFEVAVTRDGIGRPLAATSFRRGPGFVFFGPTATLPEAQRRGLVPRLQRRVLLPELLRRPWRPIHHVIRTRSPVALRLSERTFGRDRVDPCRDGRPPGAEAARIAETVADWLGQRDALEPATLRLRGAYAGLGTLYAPDREPSSDDPSIDRWFAERLAPNDALLVVGKIDVLGLRKQLRRRRRGG